MNYKQRSVPAHLSMFGPRRAYGLPGLYTTYL